MRALSAQKQNRDRALIHLHVPKTAGSSLTKILSRPPGMTIGDTRLNELEALSEAKRRELRFLFGHLSHGVAHYLPQGHLYVCVLRRPGPRLLSYYNYLYRREDHPSHAVVGGQKMSFGTFLEWAADPVNGHRNEVNNGQIRRLAGLAMQRSGSNEAQMLPQAIKNIIASDMAYGLTEHFDHFVQRLYTSGLIASTPDMRENAAPHPASLEDALAGLTTDQSALYQGFTGWDETFYNICEQLYFAQDPKGKPAP